MKSTDINGGWGSKTSRIKPLLFLGCIALTALFFGARQEAFGADSLTVWPVDVHSKIFSDSKPGKSGDLVLQAARNEYESGQFGVFSTEAVGKVTLSVTPLKHEDGVTTISADNIRLRPIGLIAVQKNTPGADKVVVRKAPCDIPDILYDSSTFELKKGESKGIWFTVFVPENALSGRYTGTVTLTSGAVKKNLSIQLEVFSFTLPSKRHLWATNWFTPDNLAQQHKVALWSEKFWRVLESYFINMASHRQNVILARWVPDGEFVKVTRDTKGKWTVDFSNLERYLLLAEKCGVAERIEFSHCGGINRQKGEVQFRSATIFDEKAGKAISVSSDEYLKPVLGALQDWLIKTKRLEKSMIHVADEPFQNEMDSWRVASKKIHDIAPKIKRIDAIESINFSGALEVWVPKLTHFDRWRSAYEDRRNDGEFWYYICCHPIGETYPNRFMDLPGTRIRVLHWINYTERLIGYLHWGYNYWVGNPFGSPTVQYGPGDTHAVYPGPLDSVRWELERESIEDYEYLVLLRDLTAKAKKESSADLWWLDPDRRGMEIGRRIVRSISDTELSSEKFAQARLETARLIESFTNGPKLIVQTFPEDNSRLYEGPIVIEVYGMTTPGATVTLNGRALSVKKDGTFKSLEWGAKEPRLEFEAKLDGKSFKTIRHFQKVK